MKLYRNAIILLVVVGLLAGAFFFLQSRKPAETGEENAPDTIKLVDYLSDDLTQITVESTEGTFVVEKKEKEWILASPKDLKADPSKLSSIAINASSIIADKKVEDNATNLAQYGLDKPVTVTIKHKDGKVKTLLFGSETPTKGGYYVKEKDSNAVYVVGSYTSEKLLVKRNEIRDLALFTMKPEDIISFSMDRKGANVFKAKKTGEFNWSMTEPIQGALSGAIDPMLQAVTGTPASEYVEENSSDLAKYGLDKPVYSFDFATSTGSYTLQLGKEKTKGSEIYAKLGNSNDVFVLSEQAFTFLDKPLREIVEVFAYIVNIDQVNRIELTLDGKLTTCELEVYKDAEGKSDNDKDKFKVNGKDASMKDENDKQPFRNFYQSLVGIGLDEIEIGAVPSGAPEISIKYYLKQAPGTVQVDFVSKDNYFYYVMKDGKYTGMLVKKAGKKDFGIEGLRDSLKTLLEFVDKAK